MTKKIKNVFFLISYLLFIFLISKHYFSEKNIIFTNKSRTSYSLFSNNGDRVLKVLKNDTNNIIIYKNDLEEFNKKRKKRIWENLISNQDE
tara:strand:- start:293 stop:565 length:273 start_codon:yes stop_codon:yes gene_type:complete